MAAMDGSNWNSKLAILECACNYLGTGLKSLGKGSFGAWSKSFADYKTKYFGRLNKSSKSTYFM